MTKAATILLIIFLLPSLAISYISLPEIPRRPELPGARSEWSWSAMSCNGCRILRKGCSETCILRPCLQWIEGAEAQGHATVFVAKFFGRAGLTAFISAVPEDQRPALFQSLLFESCGRTINPIGGAVGLLWSGNWNLCQAAVDTVLQGGALQPLTDLEEVAATITDAENEVELVDLYRMVSRRMTTEEEEIAAAFDLDLCVTPKKHCPDTLWMNSEESVSNFVDNGGGDTSCRHSTLLNLFH